jgi:hypothetical protein
VPAPGLSLTAARAVRRKRRIRSAAPIALAFAWTVAACSNPAIEKAVGQGAGAGIAVRTSGDGLTIENHTTRPLLNVRVTVTAAGSDAPFVKVVPTIDADQDADVRLSDFMSEAGIVLDAGLNAPQRAAVTARDTLGNSYSGSARW